MIYKVKVKFHEDFVNVTGNEILVGIKAKPQKGQANRELIKKLAKHFKTSAFKVRITSEMKYRSKIVDIDIK